MNTLKYLGLNSEKVAPVVKALSQLLADYQVFYANLRGFHWNVRGKGFFMLHEHYEHLYNDTANKVDEVAERILQLGERPENRIKTGVAFVDKKAENRYSEYLKVSKLQEDGFEREGRHALERVLDTLKLFIEEERAIIALANEANDDVTVSLMSDYLKGQEKLIWMLLSFLEKKKK